MRMYVANGTHQNIDFQYRLPEVKNLRQQSIPIGGQIRISGDLSQKDIDSIINCHVIYGLVNTKEMRNRRGWFVPYVYSIDEPIAHDIIRELITQNRLITDERGRQQRENAAVTVHKQIQDGTTDRLMNLEMVIEEQATKNKDAEFYEKIQVTNLQEKGAPQDPKNPTIRRNALF
jgi:hypothetical protein